METIKRIILWNPRFFIVIAIFILAVVYFISPKITNRALCPRTSYYNMPEEFKRSLSLIIQRSGEAVPEDKSPIEETEGFKKRGRIVNCLDIQYADLSNFNAEGIFYMDKDPKPDRLKIYVDQTYKNYDDLLTTLMLVHETTHALQYYDELLGENNIAYQSYKKTPENNCYDKEIEAFMMQYALFIYLNNEEKKSLVYRLQQNPYSNESYANLIQLVQFSDIAYAECGSFTNDCSTTIMADKVASFVKNSPFYQKQCQAQQ